MTIIFKEIVQFDHDGQCKGQSFRIPPGPVDDQNTVQFHKHLNFGEQFDLKGQGQDQDH